SMWLSLLSAMQYHGRLALLWHDVIVERALDTLTLTSRPQAVQRKAAVVDPQSVITAIDHFCAVWIKCYFNGLSITTRLLPPGVSVITLEFNPDYSDTARQVIRWSGLEEKVQQVEGASGTWIPRLKEHFGAQAFDLVFLDHWKDRYLPDTKLLEVCKITNLTYVCNSSQYNSHYYRSHLEYTKAESVLEKSVFLGY
uniref:catechol O-methyltransferase n=1 Tax=Oncorhynchus mykiss TaxID=8022 RepID=A0A8C7VUJ5_ONCMY